MPDPVSLALLVLAGGAIFLLAGRLGGGVADGPRRALDRIAAGLGGGAVGAPLPVGEARVFGEAGGLLDGRRVKVTLLEKDGHALARIGVAVEHGKPLRVRREAPRLWPSAGPRRAIQAADLAAARAAIARDQGELEAGLKRLFEQLGARELEASEGLLTVELALDADALARTPDSVADVIARGLAAAARVARAHDRRPLIVRVLGGERLAWTGGDERRPRCPYCRDALKGDEPDLVACASCQTVHHQECFDENGRCTVLGCESVEAERNAGRARST